MVGGPLTLGEIAVANPIRQDAGGIVNGERKTTLRRIYPVRSPPAGESLYDAVPITAPLPPAAERQLV